MVHRKFTLTVERNGTSFTGNCEASVALNVSFSTKKNYQLLSLAMDKWMRDMLGDMDYATVKIRLEDFLEQLYLNKDNTNIRVSV